MVYEWEIICEFPFLSLFKISRALAVAFSAKNALKKPANLTQDIKGELPLIGCPNKIIFFPFISLGHAAPVGGK